MPHTPALHTAPEPPGGPYRSWQSLSLADGSSVKPPDPRWRGQSLWPPRGQGRALAVHIWPPHPKLREHRPSCLRLWRPRSETSAKGHVGGPPCPLPPPTPGLLGRLPMDGSWGFPREAQQERGGGRGRKPLELSWNPPDWKGPGQRKGEERGGWAGAPPLGQDWPGSGDSFPEWPLLGPGLPQGTSRAGSRSRASTPPGPGGLGGSWRAACAPGGSGSGLGVLAPVTLVAPAGLARGSLWDPHPPSPSQGHHRLIDLSGHSTLGG